MDEVKQAFRIRNEHVSNDTRQLVADDYESMRTGALNLLNEGIRGNRAWMADGEAPNEIMDAGHWQWHPRYINHLGINNLATMADIER